MEKAVDGVGIGVQEGATVYGLFRGAGGFFSVEGTVEEAGGGWFKVCFGRISYGGTYRVSDIGRTIFLDRESAVNAAETVEYERHKAEREDFAEQNVRPI